MLDEAMTSETFYQDLGCFSEPTGFGDYEAYVPVPEDWSVLAADIVNSSQAVRDGLYKEVNFIGAAVITAVLNKLGRDKVPFVFGGDGALLLVPPDGLEEGKAALSGVAELSRDLASLELRAAAIPVSELRLRGADIRVRKYELLPGNYLAMAIGDGLELADRILKDTSQNLPFRIEHSSRAAPALDGLSCRWEPIAARKGRIVSLIVKPVTTGSNHELADFLTGLERAVGFNPLGRDEDAVIAAPDRLKFRFPPRKTGLEIAFVGAARGTLKTALKTLVENMAFCWSYFTGRSIGSFNAAPYLDELALATDHRKLDDSLRLVMDLGEADIERLKTFLAKGFVERQLIYGIHEADSALMTCFVSDLQDSSHVHFVDGANGGFSLAAVDFKERLKTLEAL